MKRNYLNFYGNLMKASDAYLVKLLDTLAAKGLLDEHARDRDRRPRRDGHRPRRDAAEELQRLRGVDPRPARLLEPAPVQEAARRTTRSSRTSTSCRRSRASSARRRSARAAWQGVDYSAQILSRSPRPRAELHRLHLRRLAVRPVERPVPRARRTTSSASASGATSSPATTTPTARCPTSGRCTTCRPTRSSASNLAHKGHKRTPRAEAPVPAAAPQARRRSSGPGCSR